MEVLVGGVAAVVGALIGALSQRRMRVAEAEHTVVDTALTIVEERNNEVAILRERLTQHERRLTALELWAKALAAQVIELGGVPVPFDGTKLP